VTELSVAEQLAAYKAEVDARYAAGYAGPAKSAAQVKREERERQRREDRLRPDWLLIDPTGKVDGWHVYHTGSWDSVEAVWRGFFPKKKEREQHQADGWVIRPDDPQRSGLSELARDGEADR